MATDFGVVQRITFSITNQLRIVNVAVWERINVAIKAVVGTLERVVFCTVTSPIADTTGFIYLTVLVTQSKNQAVVHVIIAFYYVQRTVTDAVAEVLDFAYQNIAVGKSHGKEFTIILPIYDKNPSTEK
mmetsp:Transcript_10558/g.13359  ORF Transcript_10558/g.13359 Transcript_10558/m.13359 type:complete len:129 (-) Transcript_10558:266-652(-)